MSGPECLQEFRPNGFGCCLARGNLAIISTYTILGVPYYNHSIPQNPAIKAPTLATAIVRPEGT